MQLGVWTVLRVGVAVLLTPTVGCGDCPRLSRCDVRDRDCQGSVIEAVACLRGGDLDVRPKVSVISEAQYVDRVMGLLAEDPEKQARDEARYRLWNRGLSHFRLAPADYGTEEALQDRASEVGAAYFYGDRSIVIIDRGEPLNGDGALGLLAHEVVHALRDQELDLDAYAEPWVDGYDSSLALDALVEGEAMHYQLLISVQLAGREPDEVDWTGYYRDWRARTLREAEQDEAPVALGSMRFPYAFGGGLVARQWQAHGHEGIEDLFADPPHTSSEVMFGSDQGTLADARQALHERAFPALPESFETENATALGAWIMRLYAKHAGLEAAQRSRPAEALGADMMSVQYDEASDTLVAAWRVHAIDAAQAATWPLPPDGVGERLDLEDGEIVDLVGDPELPIEPLSLAWSAPPDLDDEGGAAAGLGAPLWRSPGLVGHRACVAWTPPPGAGSSDAASDSSDDGNR